MSRFAGPVQDLWVETKKISMTPLCDEESEQRPTSFLYHQYDKQPKATNFRTLAQNTQLMILELEDATSICRRDMASFNSRILSYFF